MQRLTFSLAPVPPFRLDLTAWVLRRRSINATDSWNGEVYSRVVAIEGLGVFLQITQSGEPGLRACTLTRQPIAFLQTEKLRSSMSAKIVGSASKSDCFLSVREKGCTTPRTLPAFPRTETTSISVGVRRCREWHSLPAAQSSRRIDSVESCGCKGRDSLCNQHLAAALLFPDQRIWPDFRSETFRQLGFSNNKRLALKRLAGEVLRGTFDPAKLAHLEKIGKPRNVCCN